ncbi:hypothetical protein DUNSADRAFT_16314 [Dunaliella salina]|uniref:Encoded protein n=1 Tax=Dunaliella salina TaxID=3046 RepID=A0ABQ7G3S9_DUNSA|nr:hypothetical protein DUNSADRAFT_16314 [Dunaliella salina]|eukprot:KAF5829275.1 hypothetical protein DUNSADRAFT_16314 [Dunaliella salina]
MKSLSCVLCTFAGHLQVVPTQFEPAPWVKDLGRWLQKHTIGVARVDLRRPTPPQLDQYTGNNLFLASYKDTGPSADAHARNQGAQAGRSGSRPQPQFHSSGARGANEPCGERVLQPVSTRAPTGARVKVTRSLVYGQDPEGQLPPLLSFGTGLNVDMDKQRIEPVLRFKLRDILSVKAFPQPLLKLSKTLPLWKTGMGLKVHYEVPLADIQHFYQPPARLMVRLDQCPGSGFHVTPQGVEFDQQYLRLGRITLRGSASMTFPRSIPFDPDNDSFDFHVNRLSIKSLW